MSVTQGYLNFYNGPDERRYGRDEMPLQVDITRRWLQLVSARDGPILELGCGMGALAQVSRAYMGVDFSLVALRKFAVFKPRINADMQRLPIRSGSIRLIFSWAALEHVPYPELVLDEICRVLKPGGIVLLAPAWNCRSWAAEGLPVRDYAELGWIQRISKATIPIRDHILWRGMWALPRRLTRELRAMRGNPLPFTYSRLRPNLSEYVYTDCDAFTSMDPQAAIIFFRTRKWRVLNHRSLFSRLFARHEPVVVQKPFESPPKKVAIP
jgi:SAM-dependent methyltransferase